MKGHLALGVMLVTAAAGAAAASGTSLRVLVKHTPNKTESNRTRATINAIVIHDTEGRFIGSVRFLQRARTQGSAHFVVSRRGQIVQLVPVTDVAWHAGNRWWNLHSIGIEHEGWAGRRGYTESEYRASAKLVAYLAHRWSIPLDREHIIGHNEVPNPSRPGSFGGASGHTDPGMYWNWSHYMHLVRYYAAHRVLPKFVQRMTVLPDAPVPHPSATLRRILTRTVVHATHVNVTPLARTAATRSTVDRNATVRGRALWWSGINSATRWRRHIWKVDFLVDGRTLYTDHTWPYSFHRTVGWNSRTVGNGRHMLTVRVYGAKHYRVRKSIPVRVANPPLRIAITGAISGGAVNGVLDLGMSTDELVDRVTLYVDGKPVSRDASRPYRLVWDTTSASEGAHTLLVYARGRRRATRTVSVVVANAPQFPTSLRAVESSFGVARPEG
ncbi:MAG TPA: N-acetylmuramoyl-L-alanine amidase [Gaiellaceae bacterium]|nr:N-acetylmuramoyl-L-alanine amidase [Gaiellaceae bacterium]